ncbi:MAG TPA: bifunctional tetrahydrofolate synthase/dihydrofolate synthase [Gammaproteobacteria bacterium]|nr:bifunctional tetrahydrofolate synthase/dihydrofolate synthase [Gammaproteobacteria bacterium]
MPHRTLQDWLNWQEGLHPRGIDLGLERVRQVFANMDLGPPPFPVVTVAGTNGKGSSVALLEAVLQAAGYCTGAYTSPHLLHYNERIRVAGRPVDDEVICRAFQRIDQARGAVSLTYFEFGTLAALDIFYRGGVDVAVLEVGMGGRLDAVNILDADVALVTAIGIDHVDWLGNDRERIGREKAGIFRSGTPAVCSDPTPPNSLVAHARALDSPLFLIGCDYGFDIGQAGSLHPAWSWWHSALRHEGLPMPALAGAFQVQNAAGCLMALQCLAPRLAVTRVDIEHGLRAQYLPGRFQAVVAPVVTILDVAHNRESAAALAANLAARPIPGKTHGVVAMLGDKDMAAVLGELASEVDTWHLSTAPVARGAQAGVLARALREARAGVACTASDSAASAYETALAQAGAEDRIVVFGSFYAVSDVQQFLARHDWEFAVQSDPI